MNAAAAFEVVATAAGLIEWLSDEIEIVLDAYKLDATISTNADIWRAADAIRKAANGSITWEEAENTIVGIRKRCDE